MKHIGKLTLGLLALLLILGPAPAQSPTSTSHGVFVTWVASTSSNVAGYVLFRCSGTCTSASTAWTAVATGLILGTSYLDASADLSTGTTYSYEADAVDTSGNYSGPSNIAAVTTPTAWPTNPAPPSGCAAKVQ